MSGDAISTGSARRYRVIGVDRTTRQDVDLRIEAVSEANARVKADLDGIVVTTVEVESLSIPTPASAPSPSPQSEATDVDLNRLQALAPEVPPETPRSTNWASSVAHALTWVVLAFAGLIALGQCSINTSREVMVRDTDLPETLGYLVGINLVSVFGAAMAAFVYLASRRTVGKAAVVTALAIIAATTLLALQDRWFSTTDTQARRAVGDMAATAEKFLDPRTARDAISEMSRPTAAEYGHLAPAVSLFQDFAAGMVRDTNRYHEQVSRLRLEEILLPVRIDSPEEIADSLSKLAISRGHLDEYRRNCEEQLDRVRSAITSMDVSGATRTEFAVGFEKGLAGTWPRVQRLFAYEEAVYDETTFLLQWLTSLQGHFFIENGQVLFESEPAIAEYNASVARIQAIGRKALTDRALMSDDALATAQRFKDAASGSWEHLDSPQNAKRDINLPITIGPDGVKIDGRPLPLPSHRDQVARLLGASPRPIGDIGSLGVWDELGIVAVYDERGEMVRGLAIVLNTVGQDGDGPKSLFPGKLALNGASVSDIESPWSINRRLPKGDFALTNAGEGRWRGRLGALRVQMATGEGGLCAWIGVTLATDKELRLPPTAP